MQIKWTQHLQTEKEKQDFTNEIKASRSVLERLKQIAKEDEDQMTKAEITPSSYDSPNWEYRQADSNGYKRCLRNYKLLYDIDRAIIQV